MRWIAVVDIGVNDTQHSLCPWRSERNKSWFVAIPEHFFCVRFKGMKNRPASAAGENYTVSVESAMTGVSTGRRVPQIGAQPLSFVRLLAEAGGVG